MQNLLTVLLLTTKFKMSNLINKIESDENSTLESTNIETEKSHFMIWLTGLCTKELPIHYKMSLLSKPLQNPGQKIIFSGPLYPWRSEQTIHKLYETGNALILTSQQIQQLTRNGKEVIQIKVCLK